MRPVGPLSSPHTAEPFDPATSRLDEIAFDEVMRRFGTLEAPKIDELNGEYHARLLANPSRLRQAIWQATLSNPAFPGSWLGKAFSGSGQGYNFFAIEAAWFAGFRC